MLSSEEYKEQIDSYLKGRLNEEEASKLKQHISGNTALQNEFELQKDIISTIQANRKAELKARLNSLDVAAPFQWWKYAAVVASISAVTAWFLLSNQTTTTPETIIISEEISRNNDSTPFQEESTKAIEANKEATTSKPSGITVQESKKDLNANKTVKASKKVTASKEEAIHPNLPNLHSPDLAPHEPLSKDLETPDHSLTESKHVSTAVAGVEVVKSKKHKFHYRYFDNKLFLYGDFDARTYDILELNTSKGQKLYLKFETNYYGLEPNKTEISKLEQVKDKNTLKELEEIQKK